jgi:glycosyltransferase involved in cell wall biosynthesis
MGGSPNNAMSDHEQASAPVGALVMPGRLLMVEQGGRGGVADYTAQLVRALAADGWQIEMATAEDHLYQPTDGVTIHRVFHYVRGRTRLGHAVRRLGLGPIANGLRFLASLPRLVLLSRRSDLIHTQGWELAPLGVVAIACLRLSGGRIVQTSHNTFERGRPRDRTHRLLARLTARTIVHTKADLERVPSQANGRVVVIPHGEYGGLARTGGAADRDRARASLGIAPDAPVTLLFGHLRLDKGLDHLLAALARVPRLHLLVGGKEDGALAAARAQLENPALAGRVTVREGFLDMREAAELFAATDTVALPYTVASQSGVLLLAYGFHRPVVIYPVGGLIEAVIDGETGWICPRPDVDGLITALTASVDAGWAECRRRGEAGASLAEERFAWPAIARRTSELYSEVLR